MRKTCITADLRAGDAVDILQGCFEEHYHLTLTATYIGIPLITLAMSQLILVSI